MKLFAYLALIFGAAAVQLTHKHGHKLATKTQGPPPIPEEEWGPFMEWLHNEVAEGGTITLDELHDYFGGVAEAHGIELTNAEYEWLADRFHEADTDGSGEVDAIELRRAVGGPPPQQPGGPPPLPEEEWGPLMEWLHNEVQEGGTITVDELHNYVQGVAESHGITLENGHYVWLADRFNEADTSGDGHVDAHELAAAIGGGPPPEEHANVQLSHKMGHKLRHRNPPPIPPSEFGPLM